MIRVLLDDGSPQAATTSKMTEILFFLSKFHFDFYEVDKEDMDIPSIVRDANYFIISTNESLLVDKARYDMWAEMTEAGKAVLAVITHENGEHEVIGNFFLKVVNPTNEIEFSKIIILE